MTHTPDGATPSTGPGTEQVLVSPRYLAGESCDDAWSAWTEPMGQRGWTMLDDGADTTVLVSPCLRVRCGWLPETSVDDIQIAASVHPLASPLWHVALRSTTPTEFLTAVTSWVAETLATKPEAVFPAHGPRWTPPVDLPVPDGWYGSDDSPHAVSPDKQAYYTRSPSRFLAADRTAESQDGWEFEAASHYMSWRACFSAATPPALVELFHAAFTDPEPLPRNPALLDPWRGSEVIVIQPKSFAHAPVSARHFTPASPRPSNAGPRSNPSAQASHHSR